MTPISEHLLSCPYCGEEVELSLEADLASDLVWDCEVCCRPWAVSIFRDLDGDATVTVRRLDE